jgi:hypothetical protein
MEREAGMKALGWMIAALTAAVLGPASAAPACTAKSGAHTVALVELYTSEGCSSCPPADRFLAARRAAGLTPSQAVLLSLHVDYWNHIGWKDPYSRKAYTERQRWLSDLARTRTIYTPEFFVGGKELRNWDEGLHAAVGRINAQPARAHIAMRMTPGPTGLGMQVNASGAAGASLHLALVESGIATRVAAGENRGRTLQHDFVVREWLEPVTLGGDGRAQLNQMLAIPANAVRAKLGVAAFVQTEQGEVLQALSMDTCSG